MTSLGDVAARGRTDPKLMEFYHDKTLKGHNFVQFEVDCSDDSVLASWC